MKKLEWMKRVGVMTLAVAMTMGVLAGCGSSTAASKSASEVTETSSDSESAVEAIKARGVLHYGTEDSAVGFGYLNPETNEYEGLEADLGRLIAEELGVDVEFTTVVTNTR